MYILDWMGTRAAKFSFFLAHDVNEVVCLISKAITTDVNYRVCVAVQ